jgi:hypothetical protein
MISLSPNPVSFGNVGVGLSSNPITSTLRNTGGSAIRPVIGAPAGDFAIAMSSCAVEVAPGASCTFQIVFRPVMPGLRTGALTVSAPGVAPVTLALQGRGLVVDMADIISPDAADFGGRVVGETSPGQIFTIRNLGGGPGQFRIEIGGANAADFAVAPGPTNGCGTTLAAGASCTVIVTFTPAATGERRGSLVVTASMGGQSSAALRGTGLRRGDLHVSPAANDFGSVPVGSPSGAANFSLTNPGHTDVTMLAVAITGAGMSQFSISNNTCGSVLSAGATCTIAVVFRPTSSGAKMAILSVTASGLGGLASLSGTGVPPADVSISPRTMSFGRVAVNQRSTDATFTVTNFGGGASATLGTAISSPQFIKRSDGCAGRSLVPGETCSIVVAFAPTTAGDVMATLTVTAGAASGTATLTGAGIYGDALFFFDPATGAGKTLHDFGALTVGFRSQSGSVVLRNTGNTPSAMLGAPRISGPAEADFGVESSTCGPPLAPGASCTITFFFKPVGAGDRQATLTITDAFGNSAGVALAGKGLPLLELVPHEGGVLKPTAPAGAPADFGQGAIGTAPAAFPGQRDFVLVARAATGALAGSVISGAPPAFRIRGVASCQNRVKIVSDRIVTSSLTTAVAPGTVPADGQSFTHAGLDPMNQSDPELASVCLVTVQFAPQAPAGDKTGTLSVTAATGGLTSSHGLRGLATP